MIYGSAEHLDYGRRFLNHAKRIDKYEDDQQELKRQEQLIRSQAADYCRKDGDFVEHGELFAQGNRSDLDAFKHDVKAGVHDLKILRETHSVVYAKYERWCRQYIRDQLPPVIVEDLPLRNWQAWLNVELNRPADDRRVIFIVDPVGNSGKTWFAKWYISKHQSAQYLCPGKRQDVAYMIERNRVYFIDCARTLSEFIPYHLIEEMKNGMVYCPKYDTHLKQLDKCHVVVLMNEDPKDGALSADRYHIKRIKVLICLTIYLQQNPISLFVRLYLTIY
jgi:hypothetical protein